MNKEQVKITRSELDEALAPVGLSYFDLEFAYECRGVLTESWFEVACERLEELFGDTSFLIVVE